MCSKVQNYLFRFKRRQFVFLSYFCAKPVLCKLRKASPEKMGTGSYLPLASDNFYLNFFCNHLNKVEKGKKIHQERDSQHKWHLKNSAAKMKEKRVHTAFYSQIAALLQAARKKVVQTVNQTMVPAYFKTGKISVKEEQIEKERTDDEKQVKKLFSI